MSIHNRRWVCWREAAKEMELPNNWVGNLDKMFEAPALLTRSWD
jgi:NADH:ubiquinone oxidoreductase subunit